MHIGIQILFTACSLVVLVGCLLAYTRSVHEADRAERWRSNIETNAMKFREALPRVTTLEREVEALRRELRKLGGKFYATQRELSDEPVTPAAAIPIAVCDNYARAQQEGPTSDAASCECDYCTRRRKEKREFRDRQASAGHLDPRWVAAHTAGTGNHGE